jgi:hypothetical protein
LQGVKALGQGGVLRGLALGQGCVKRREALLQAAFKPGEGAEQLGAAIARFGHGLRQALVDCAAQPFQRGLRGLCEAAQLLAHAVHRAIVLGHGKLGGLCSLLQRLQAGQPLGRQIDPRAAQQHDHQQHKHQGQGGQQNEGIGSQGRFTMFLIAASA